MLSRYQMAQVITLTLQCRYHELKNVLNRTRTMKFSPAVLKTTVPDTKNDCLISIKGGVL